MNWNLISTNNNYSNKKRQVYQITKNFSKIKKIKMVKLN